MKALITAFALLSFVAASTIPLVARAADPTTESTMPKKAKTKKPTKKAAAHKKTKTNQKMKKPNPT
jgi:hypothetical protein